MCVCAHKNHSASVRARALRAGITLALLCVCCDKMKLTSQVITHEINEGSKKRPSDVYEHIK